MKLNKNLLPLPILLLLGCAVLVLVSCGILVNANLEPKVNVPTPTISGLDTVNGGNSIQLTASGSGDGVTYYWTLTGNGTIGSSGASVILSATNYSEQVTVGCYAKKNANSTSLTATKLITVNGTKLIMPTITIGTSTTVYLSNSTLQITNSVIQLTASGSGTNATYHWINSGSGTFSASAGDTVTFTVPSIRTLDTISCYSTRPLHDDSSTNSTNIHTAYLPVTNGLYLWLDGSDLSSIQSNHGAQILQWNDKSEQTLVPLQYAYQATSNNQPMFVAGVQNGHSAVYFDGTNDHYSNVINMQTHASSGNATIFTVFMHSNVYVSTALYNKGGIWATGSYANSVFAPMVYTAAATSNLYLSYGNNGVWTLANPIPANAYHFGTGQWIVSSVTYIRDVAFSLYQTQLRKNGSLAYSGNLNNNGINNYWLQFQIGHRPGSGYYRGYIAEILIFKRVLTTSERWYIESYLADKWSIAVTNSL